MEPRRTTPGEAGFSLVELIVVMTLLTLALGAILTVVERTTQMSNDDRERAHAIRGAQAELDTVVREARQAFRVNPSTARRLDVSVHKGGVTRRLIFDCNGAHPTMSATWRCTRQEMLSDGSLTTPTVAIDRVRNTTVFEYTAPSGATDHVAVTIEVPASGERVSGSRSLIRLNDGFAVRNRGLVP